MIALSQHAARPPEVGNGFAPVLAACRGAEPLRCAIVHPADAAALGGALEARDAGLIVPVLVGPARKIDAAAAAISADLSGIERIGTEHSHAAADAAVAMARAGQVEALMKGSLHTDELMAAIVARDTGLRTARRISHVFVMDVPAYARLLLITDAAVNITPTLEEKADIVQNAVEVAQAIGIALPKVAILSAVETVSPKLPSTIDAAALCKMADRGQITGCVVDGPLAFDNAISPESAKAKGIRSAVAGQADILVVPDLEAGNMLAKQLAYFANARGAGVVMGARVPIVLTSRSDPTEARLASAAVALLVARARLRRIAAAAAAN
ncbi:MAG: bifunctional enoyl-CoA hydratase/phosphate acetyltransferase [Alphaproteobacteria bacterium]|nr:bifunctional enoyl-CoA hydratase/phosphate acetyltransferase [Alphaproteobacteria bacterium]